MNPGCQLIHAQRAALIKELNRQHAHIRPLLEQCARNVVSLRLRLVADIGCRHFRGEQNPFAVTILGERVERSLAAYLTRRNHRQLAVKVNRTLNH